MVVAFTAVEERMLRDEMLTAFGCSPNQCMSAVSRKEARRLSREAEQREIAARRYFAVMNSDNPPKTEDEAVGLAIPFGAWLLSFIFKSLAEAVIRWLWQRSQES